MSFSRCHVGRQERTFPTAGAVGLSVLVMFSAWPAASGDAWNLSCLRSGAIVHEEVIPGDADAIARDKIRSRIAKRYPGSICVSMKGQPKPPLRVAAPVEQKRRVPEAPEPASDTNGNWTAPLKLDTALGSAALDLLRRYTDASKPVRHDRHEGGADYALSQALAAISGEMALPEERVDPDVP